MTKIAFIGAGSLGFTRELVRDILTFPLLCDATLVLMDIDAERLDFADICRDIERYCPGAYLLNYSNPMAMLCRAMQRETTVRVTGLCHSVQFAS